jgi:hypothetical protein
MLRAVAVADEGRRDDWVYLTYEQDAAVSCLRRSWDVLADYRFAASEAEPLFVLLATGVEKLLKLTYGLTLQADTGAWPSQEVMSARRNGWGHRVAELDAECRRLIRAGMGRAVHAPYVTSLFDELDADPYVVPWLEALQRYAVNGRFYNFDHLADAGQPAPSPRQLWDELYNSVARSDPQFSQLLGKSQADWDVLVRRTTGRLADSLWRWWEAYYRAWIQGVCGPMAKQHSGTLAPPKR